MLEENTTDPLYSQQMWFSSDSRVLPASRSMKHVSCASRCTASCQSRFSGARGRVRCGGGGEVGHVCGEVARESDRRLISGESCGRTCKAVSLTGNRQTWGRNLSNTREVECQGYMAVGWELRSQVLSLPELSKPE